jgi:1-phosphatidylinositol-3-phosphate 5-kinase
MDVVLTCCILRLTFLFRCLSFAKFLELKFHAHFYKRRAADENMTSVCKHSLHKDYVQFFSHNGITASFMYTSIEVWEICLPALVVELKPSKASENGKILEEVKQFAQKGYEVFVKIHDRLAELTTETEFPMLKSLKFQLNEDQLGFKKRVAAVQTCLTEKTVVSLDVKDAMFMMKRKLAECIEAWSTR